jgi:two-component system, chemotaxis family, protein-glutamate methylesterase/glutaminase
MRQPLPKTLVDRNVNPPAVVAIGASTGGPQALRDLLSRLPEDFSPPVLIVQHIAPGFVPSLHSYLAAEVKLPVQVAVNGQSLRGPGAFIAPTDTHLEVRQRSIILSDSAPVSGHRPSATVLFRSVAREFGRRAIGVVLTGMGDDGTAGLEDLKRTGATIIAQNEETSVIFGMPDVAIRSGIVDYVLPPDRIAELLIMAMRPRNIG